MSTNQHITMYIEDMKLHPIISHSSNPSTVMDIEISEETAKVIVDELKKELDDNKIVGAIRIRITGRLTIS
jgi:hypothetical protein